MDNKEIENRLLVYEEVNKCETVDELKKIIVQHFPYYIQGRSKSWNTVDMIRFIEVVEKEWNDGERVCFSCLPTREYGIRQQVYYVLLGNQGKRV